MRQEEKKVETHGTHDTEDVVDQTNRLDPRRYSSRTRLVRVTAWIKRFVKNCKAPSEFRTEHRAKGRPNVLAWSNSCNFHYQIVVTGCEMSVTIFLSIVLCIESHSI